MWTLKLLRGSQHLEIGSNDPDHANLGVVLYSYAGRSVLHLCNKFEADCSLHSKVIRGFQNLEIGSRDPGHAHLGSFYDPFAGRVRPLYVYTKFEADSSFRSKVISSPKISKLGHVTLSHAHFEPETLNLCRHPSNHTCCQILCF